MHSLWNIGGPPSWWPPFIAAAATLLVGIAALSLAYRQLQTQRRIAQRRNTIDLIVKFETDAYYQKALATFRKLARGEITATDIVGATTDDQREVRNEINAFLNYCELMALSLRRGTIDHEIFFQWWGSPLVDIWNFSVGTINLLRAGPIIKNPKRFVNFEVVARHFARRLALESINIGFTEPEIGNAQPLMIRDSAP